jgi:hypothetical protein
MSVFPSNVIAIYLWHNFLIDLFTEDACYAAIGESLYGHSLHVLPYTNLLAFSMSQMKRASSLSEWQLQAVLYKAKLTQYYETFISQVIE